MKKSVMFLVLGLMAFQAGAGEHESGGILDTGLVYQCTDVNGKYEARLNNLGPKLKTVTIIEGEGVLKRYTVARDLSIRCVAPCEIYNGAHKDDVAFHVHLLGKNIDAHFTSPQLSIRFECVKPKIQNRNRY